IGSDICYAYSAPGYIQRTDAGMVPNRLYVYLAFTGYNRRPCSLGDLSIQHSSRPGQQAVGDLTALFSMDSRDVAFDIDNDTDRNHRCDRGYACSFTKDQVPGT